MPATSDITMLTDRGQLQVPAWVREQLELQPGQRFAWRVLADGDVSLHIIRPAAVERRRRWRAYVNASQSSDALLAEAREGEAEDRQALGL